ncbi:MAG: gamma carbonic anhydrase family protein [Rhodopirellula bahusiensis]
MPCVIGERVTVGHSAIVHGATVEDDALIGIGAIVLNGATIGKGAIVAAGALVTEGTVIPPGMLAVGTPAKPIKEVSDSLRERSLEGAQHYVRLGRRYRTEFVDTNGTSSKVD